MCVRDRTNDCSAHLSIQSPGRSGDYLDMVVSWYRRMVGPSSGCAFADRPALHWAQRRWPAVLRKVLPGCMYHCNEAETT